MTQPQALSQPAPRLADTLVVVAYMTVVQAHSSMAALWLPAIAPKVAAAVGLPAAMIGYQVLLMYLGAMTTSLFVGGMIARFGAWRTCQASMFMFAAAHLLLMTGRPAVMALGSVVLGLGYGMVNPPGAHLLAKVVTPRNRNLVFSVRFTGVPLGGILASLLAPRLTLAFDWQASMLFTGLAGLVLFLAMQPLRARWDADRDRAAPAVRNPLVDVRAAWKLVPLRWLCFTGLFSAGAQISLTSFTVTLLVEEIGYGLVAAGYALTAVQIAGVAGRVSWGAAADRFRSGYGVLVVITLITLACAVGAVHLTGTWPKWAVYALFFVFGFAAMGWNGVFAGEIARLSPANRVGNMTAAALFFTFSGVIAGPVVFANVYTLTGRYTSTFWMTAVLAVATLATVLMGWRAARRA